MKGCITLVVLILILILGFGIYHYQLYHVFGGDLTSEPGCHSVSPIYWNGTLFDNSFPDTYFAQLKLCGKNQYGVWVQDANGGLLERNLALPSSFQSGQYSIHNPYSSVYIHAPGGLPIYFIQADWPLKGQPIITQFVVARTNQEIPAE